MSLQAPTFSFPKNFVWGVSASAPQIEGAVSTDGKGESVWDRFARRRGAILNFDSLLGDCVHYQGYKKDFSLMSKFVIML
jgi:beta-glucosidase